ncbi:MULTISPECIES: hypothetical protein [Acidobacteriaceae]|nr:MULTISPECIES: hypothetical protein [Acidobacteriaceae]MDW5265223.1 hypothetical protein [Edaphobacter sp.]
MAFFLLEGDFKPSFDECIGEFVIELALTSIVNFHLRFGSRAGN